MSDDPDKTYTMPKVRFSPEVTLGQVIQALVVAVGFLYAVTSYMSRVDTAQTGLTTVQIEVKALREEMTKQGSSLRGDMSVQMSALRSDMANQLSTIQTNSDRQSTIIRTDIANLPDMRAILDQLTKRVDQADSRFDAQSKRLEAIQAVGAQNSADITAVLRLIPTRQGR